MDARLAGEIVAFTGRMASLTRVEAVALVRRCGGEFARSVGAETTMLVIGQEGWPLQADGRLTRKLRRARQLIETGTPIQVFTEEDWLQRLELHSPLESIRRLLSASELTRLLQISRDRLRAWMRAGLVSASHQVCGVGYFAFREVSGVRTLCDLWGRGVSTDQIQRSLRQLRAWMPDVENCLSVLERDGRLLVRLRDEQLAETSGQLCWDFSDESQIAVAVAQSAPNAGEWFERGWLHEQRGLLPEAEYAYRQALACGPPNAQICLNLGNVLLALGRADAAVERFSESVELDPEWAEAWNNLGHVLAELGRFDDAIAAFEKSIVLDGAYADPLYNLADLLTELNRPEAAARHWRRYLELEAEGAWADYARIQLAAV